MKKLNSLPFNTNLIPFIKIIVKNKTYRKEIKIIHDSFIYNENRLIVCYHTSATDACHSQTFIFPDLSLIDLKDLYGIFIHNKLIARLIYGNEIEFNLAINLYQNLKNKIRKKALKRYIF